MTNKTQIKKQISWASYYWLGAIVQIALVSCATAIFRQNRLRYESGLSLLFLVLGGTSSAIWGIIISKKSGMAASYGKIFIDFFRLKQPLKYYLLAVIFLLINFGIPFFTGQIVSGLKWYSFVVLFGQSIIFGGIEEIGWRYTFQPLLEKKFPFAIASTITFASWGLWHYMYFYITGSISNINHTAFLTGLLGAVLY